MERTFFQPNQLLPDAQMDEEVDEYNDETFGTTGPLSDEWEYGHQTQADEIEKLRGKNIPLPSFFESQLGEEFLEEPLEPSGQETVREFTTAKRNLVENDDFFFLDTETEANAQLDSQMESMFTLVLDDEEEKTQILEPKLQATSSSIPISTQGQVASEAKSYENFSPLSREASIWSAKSPMGSPGGENTWNASPSTISPYSRSIERQEHRVPYSDQGDSQRTSKDAPDYQGTNPLAKFFGSAIVNQPLPPSKLPPGQTGKVISVEELEAKLRSNVVPQVIAQQHSSLSHPQSSTVAASNIPTQQMETPLFSQEQFPVLSAFQQAQKQSPVLVQQQQRERFPQAFAASNNRPSNISSAPRDKDSQNRTPYRPRWKEGKEMMSAEEIDSIIRMQEAQLNNTGSNPFAEDFYYVMRKQRPELGDDITLHKPLFESNLRPNITKKPGTDPLEGVLGRIPSHSVRAPRPLLQLKQEGLLPFGVIETSISNPTNTSSKVIQSLLITIENAFNFLLEIEDIDMILRHSASANHFNVQHLRNKREELTLELFKSIHIHVPPLTNLPQRKDSGTFIYPEDDIFMNLTLVKKGKKLITRALPLLFQNQALAIFFVYMRNLALLVTSPRLDMDVETTNRLFSYLINMINVGSVPQTILALQTILTAHLNEHLVKILQSKFGSSIVQTILKRGHDLNLSPFSREEQFAPIGSVGFHWRETIHSFLHRMNTQFNFLFDSEIGRTSKIWEFFAVLVVNINYEQKKLLLIELGNRIKSTPGNPTLTAFLQLSGQSFGK